MAQFPPWLPSPVTAHAKRLLDSGGLDEESKARLLALTSDPGMQKVWKALCKAAPEDTALVEFLDQARLHYTLLYPSPWHALSPAQQRKSFGAIAKHATALLRELEHLAGPNGHAESGLAELESALRRAAGASASQGLNTDLIRALSLREDLEPTEEASLAEQLRALAEAAQMAAATPPPPGPRKLKAQNAARTAYIQDLSRFVQSRFREPFHEAVATTVNVSLGLYENPVNADLVRHVIDPPRNIPRKTRR